MMAMLGITKNPSTRILVKSLLCASLAVFVLLGALVLPGAARAAEPVAQQAPEATPPAVPVAEPTPEATPPAQATPPTEPTTEDVLPVGPLKEQATEDLPTAPTTEPVAESLPASPPVAPQNAAPPNDPADPATAEVSSALIGSPTTGRTAGNPGGLWAISTASPASIEAPPQFSAAQRVAGLGCELSGLAGPVAYGCTARWLGGQSLLLPSTVDIATEAAARVGVPAGDADGGYGGSTGGSRSVSPPGPAPGGAFGGSATGGSGIAISGFFSLAGLLLLAAPRAMRRLRLSCQPWLTAFFVLIPERPG